MRINRNQAIDILNARGKETAYELAEKYSVSAHTIWAVWSGRRWGNLSPDQKRTTPAAIPEDDVAYIKKMIGVASPEEIAEKLGYKPATILAIWRGKRHTKK